MNFFLATIGDRPWHDRCLQEWRLLAAADSVGRHAVVAGPNAADRVVFVDLHQHPHDPFLRDLRNHPLTSAYADKVQVYDQRDRPVRTFSGVYVSAKGRWAGSVTAGGPYPYLHNSEVSAVEAVEPDLLWSFCGAMTHPVRQAILRLPRVDAEIRDTSSVPMFAGAPDVTEVVQARADYARLMRRSRYVLSPRGHGPSSFRLFETLASGRVPVIISDDWLPPPRVDWAQCSIRVREKDVDAIPDLLRARSSSDWSLMRAAAEKVWVEHLAPDRLWDHLAGTLAGLRTTGRRTYRFRPEALRLHAARTLSRGRTTLAGGHGRR